MIVKVCGVRSADVAAAAVSEGADWIGLVFEPKSPRYVDDTMAREVAAAVGGRADLVGVFVAPTMGECEDKASRYGLAAVQVHRGVDADFAAACSVPVIRAVNVTSREDALTLSWWPDLVVLLDSAVSDGELPGGTGRSLDRQWAAEVARHRRIVLAGGLGATDVAEAITVVRPFGVDASSKLEKRLGEKDITLVRAYVGAARSAFAALATDDAHA